MTQPIPFEEQHGPQCTCSSDVADVMRAAFEGRPIEPCEIHRPAHMVGAPPALNSDALTNSIAARLGATIEGANL